MKNKPTIIEALIKREGIQDEKPFAAFVSLLHAKRFWGHV